MLHCWKRTCHTVKQFSGSAHARTAMALQEASAAIQNAIGGAPPPPPGAGLS